MSVALLASAWLLGALGGLHCAAMCGGLLAAIGARDAQRFRALVPAKIIALRHLGYHGGRLFTYALLGAVFGSAGSFTSSVIDLLPYQRAMYGAANVVLLILGFSIVVRGSALMRRVAVLHAFQRAGLTSIASLLPVLGPIVRRDDIYGRVGMGLIWGLMPCAMVYSALPLALMAGGAAQGAAVMLAFGLGTLPNLITLGAAVHGVRRWLSSRTARLSGALLMVGFGLLGIHRVLFATVTLAQGPFCLVP
jgi:sulfite exporter TauE/SafE